MADGTNDEEKSDTPTMRRMVVSAMGNSTLHKSMNWTALAGVIATAVLGYMSDARTTKATESIASEAATEIAVLEAWKASAEVQLAAQGEQIARLREAVAALRAAEHAQHRQWRGDNVDQLLDASAPVAVTQPDSPAPEALRRKLLGEP